jgi:hypothetical protein
MGAMKLRLQSPFFVRLGAFHEAEMGISTDRPAHRHFVGR